MAAPDSVTLTNATPYMLRYAITYTESEEITVTFANDNTTAVTTTQPNLFLQSLLGSPLQNALTVTVADTPTARQLFFQNDQLRITYVIQAPTGDAGSDVVGVFLDAQKDAAGTDAQLLFISNNTVGAGAVTVFLMIELRPAIYL